MSPKPYSVTVHPFPSQTPCSCAYERGSSSSKHSLVFIGGLTSGPHSTHLSDILFTDLNAADLDYSLWEFRMRSSYTGFGYSSLANDVEDISALVQYLRDLGKNNIVLLGSSTGCQAIISYAASASPNFPLVNAYILQAPTSDRETASLLMPPELYAQTLQHAETMIEKGEQDEIMPKALIPPIFHSPITAYRWHSLIAKGGDDDIFSSDLPDSSLAATFGKVGKFTLIMPSECDEMVPPSVDKLELLHRWISALPFGTSSGISGLNPGADHTLSTEEAQKWFIDKVVRFLSALNEARSLLKS